MFVLIPPSMAFMFFSFFAANIVRVASIRYLLITVGNDSDQEVSVQWSLDKKHKHEDQKRIIQPRAVETLQSLDSPSIHIIICHDCPPWLIPLSSIEASHLHITVHPDLHITYETTLATALHNVTQWIHPCKAKAIDAFSEGTNIMFALQDMSICIQGAIHPKLYELQQRQELEEQRRRRLANQFESYTCRDDELSTSKPIQIDEWIDPVTNSSHAVHILHHRRASRVQLIENFISDEECLAIEKETESRLSRANTFDGHGGSMESENRKAMNAAILVSGLPQTHPIHALIERIFRYANGTIGDDIHFSSVGQENLMSIHYTGRGAKDMTPDQYHPHCDGDCKGQYHKQATRVATMLMYCTIPTQGGATNFRNAGLHIRGKKHQAVFFSYIDPETKIMDNGFTEHSGCPVVEGTKVIATEWIRLGVTEELPWNAYNTLGERISPELDTLRKQFESWDWKSILAEMQNDEVVGDILLEEMG